MLIDTTYLERCVDSLERTLILLNKADQDSVDYDMYRSVCVKEFEIILEQTGKLLRKMLKRYFHSSREVDALTFKDVFRYAVKHGLLSVDDGERWLVYRTNRNSTVHDYGVSFAEETLVLLPQFIVDTRSLVRVVKGIYHD